MQCFLVPLSPGVRRDCHPPRSLKKPLLAVPEPLPAQSVLTWESRHRAADAGRPPVSDGSNYLRDVLYLTIYTPSVAATHSVSLGKPLALLSHACGSYTHTNTHGHRRRLARSWPVYSQGKNSHRRSGLSLSRLSVALPFLWQQAEKAPTSTCYLEGPAERLRGGRRGMYEWAPTFLPSCLVFECLLPGNFRAHRIRGRQRTVLNCALRREARCVWRASVD